VCFARAAGTDALIPPALAWRMVQAHSLRDELDEALAVHGRGEPGSADTADEALLLAWTASVQRRRGEFETARELAARALAAANASGDDRAIAAAHTAAALVAPADRDAGGRDGHLTQALDAAERAHDVLQVIRIRNNRASNQLEEGRYESAIDELDATIDLAELVGFVGLLALALMNRGLARWCLGRLDEAGADYEAAAVHYRKAGSREISYAIIGQGDVYRERGNLAMARACYEEGLTLAERSGDLQGLVPALYQLAKVLVDEQPERATRAAERAVAYGWPDPAWALNAAGWVALAHGDRERAAATAAQARAAAHEERDRFGLAESLELEGAATDGPTRAQTLYEEALSTWRALGNPIHEAAVELALAGVAPGPATAAARERAERKLRTLGVRVSSTGPAGLLRHVADAPAIPVRIEALGGFSVQRAGRPIRLEEWRSRKARDLLKILVARRRRPAPRDFLMEALWPDADVTKLGNRLSVALSTLRVVLDPEKLFDADHFVHADKEAVRLDNVASDVETFLDETTAGLSLRAAGRDEQAISRLEYAEAIYAGDFLEEDRYEDWAVALREEARTAYVRVTRALAGYAATAGDDAAAAAYLLRILERDVYDERAHLDLVRVLASGRQHGEARRAYRMYVQRMAEIGLEPATFSAATT
jgi:DNA-binding SARP family transcriptional activator